MTQTYNNKPRYTKAYEDLTPAGQKARNDRHAEEKAKKGLTNVLARTVYDTRIKKNKDGSKSAIFRLAVHEKKKDENNNDVIGENGKPVWKKTWYMTASAYVAENKEQLLNFYTNGVKKGDLVSVDFKTVKGYNNIYGMMSREDAYQENRQKEKTKVEAQKQVEAKQPATLSMN